MPITLERTPVQNQLYAKGLLDMGIGIGTVARKVGMGKDTVTAIRDNHNLNPSMLERFKARMPLRFAQLVDDTLDLMDRDDIKKAPIQTRMWIAGVATDKMQALEGTNRPVFNVVNVVQNIERNLGELERKQAALLALKSVQTTVVA